MITCPKCGIELNDNAKFCRECGAKIEKVKCCPKCGTEVRAEMKFCKECGTALSVDSVKNNPGPANFINPTTMNYTAHINELNANNFPEQHTSTMPINNPNKKKGKGALVGAIAAIAVVIVAVAAVIGVKVIPALLSKLSKQPVEYAMYIKDNEIYISNLSSGESWQLTSKMISDSYGEINVEFICDYNANTPLSDYCAINAEKQLAFYLDYMTYHGGLHEGSFYCRDISSPDGKAIKIAPNVSAYNVSDDGTLVTYVTYNDHDEKGYLCQYNTVEDTTTRIDEGGLSLVVSDDGKIIYYRSDNRLLYIKEFGKDSEVIDYPNRGVYGTNADYTTIYYHKDDEVYKKTIGEDKVKLASRVSEISEITDTDEVFYYGNDGIYYAVIDGNTFALDGYYESYDAENNMIYYSVYGEGLYSVKVENGTMTDPEKASYTIHYGPNGEYMYSGDAHPRYYGYYGELWYYDEIIDYDVRTYYLTYNEATDEMVYLTDEALKICKDGEKIKIADNVQGYEVLSDGSIICFDSDRFIFYGTNNLRHYKSGKINNIAEYSTYTRILPDGGVMYLINYNDDLHQSDLYYYKNGESMLISERVQHIMDVSDSKNRGSWYLRPNYYF